MENKIYKCEFTAAEIDIIVASLGEQRAKLVMPVLAKIEEIVKSDPDKPDKKSNHLKSM